MNNLQMFISYTLRIEIQGDSRNVSRPVVRILMEANIGHLCRPTEKRSIYILVELRKMTFCDFCVFRLVSQKVSKFQKFFCGIIIYHAWLYNYTL